VRRSCRHAVAAFVVSAVLGLGACSSGGSESHDSIPVADGAAAYCERLATLPEGLKSAVSNPKSSDSKATIGRAVTQLQKEAVNKSVPKRLRTTLGTAAAALSKVRGGKQVSESEANSLLSLEEEVKKTCSN